MSEQWVKFDGPYPSLEVPVGNSSMKVYASPYDIPSFIKGEWLPDDLYRIDVKYLDGPATSRNQEILVDLGPVKLYGDTPRGKGTSGRIARIEIKSDPLRHVVSQALENARKTLNDLLEDGKKATSEKANFASVEAALKVLED